MLQEAKGLDRAVLHIMGWGGPLAAGLYLAYSIGWEYIQDALSLIGMVGAGIALADETLEHFLFREPWSECFIDVLAKTAGVAIVVLTARWWWKRKY